MPDSKSKKFRLGDISYGDPFTYSNGDKVVSGSVGRIRPHNNGTVLVIYNQNNLEVCAINNSAEKIQNGNTIVVPTGERTAFSFEPARLALY